MFMMACEKPYMNVQVRQALMHALDRDSLIKTVTYGFGKSAPAIMMYPKLFPNSSLPQYDYNPDKAKQLLTEGKWDPSRKLVFGQLTKQGAPDATYSAMINMWKAVGVDTQFLPMDPANSTKLWIANPHTWDVNMTSYAWLAYDPTSTYQEIACNVPGNYPHYCSPKYDELMQQATRTLDEKQSIGLFQQIQTILETDLPYAPIWIEPEIWAIAKSVHGGVLGRGPLNDIQAELWWKE
jgi:ABC-type transport system substrate-binding protein